jgi:hypothetical protein
MTRNARRIAMARLRLLLSAAFLASWNLAPEAARAEPHADAGAKPMSRRGFENVGSSDLLVLITDGITP